VIKLVKPLKSKLIFCVVMPNQHEICLLVINPALQSVADIELLFGFGMFTRFCLSPPTLRNYRRHPFLCNKFRLLFDFCKFARFFVTKFDLCLIFQRAMHIMKLLHASHLRFSTFHFSKNQVRPHKLKHNSEFLTSRSRFFAKSNITPILLHNRMRNLNDNMMQQSKMEANRPTFP